MIINSRFFNRSELIGFIALAVLLFLILPLSLDVFRLNLVAKYLTYAFVAIGLVLCWGYGGILSLGQGVFFGLGGYWMAMFKSVVGEGGMSSRCSNRCYSDNRRSRCLDRKSTRLNSSHKTVSRMPSSA